MDIPLVSFGHEVASKMSINQLRGYAHKTTSGSHVDIRKKKRPELIEYIMNIAEVARATAFRDSSQKSPEESEWKPSKKVHSEVDSCKQGKEPRPKVAGKTVLKPPPSYEAPKRKSQQQQKAKRKQHVQRSPNLPLQSTGSTQRTRRTARASEEPQEPLVELNMTNRKPKKDQALTKRSTTRRVTHGRDSVTLEYTSSVTTVTDVVGGGSGSAGAFPNDDWFNLSMAGPGGSMTKMFNEASDLFEEMGRNAKRRRIRQ